MKLIRCEETDSDKKRRLIIKLCELRVRLAQMNEEMDEKYLNGHRFNNRPNSSSSISINSIDSRSNSPHHRFPLITSSSSSLMCDVCLKKQNMIPLPVAIFKTYQPNYIFSCDFCDYKIHRNCMTSVSVCLFCPASFLTYCYCMLCHCMLFLFLLIR